MAPTTPVMESRVNERSVWIFGYGSLIWNPGFKYSKRIIGYVEGYKRRLWQKNTTHRGTPNSPGRVATLVEDSESRTTGVAYELVGEEQIREATGHCDVRENVLGGYTTLTLPFYSMESWETSEPRVAIPVRVHIATPDNKLYTGPTSTDEQARQISKSAGATGHNVEYVVRIAEFVRGFSSPKRVHDDDLLDIENKIKCLLRNDNISVSYLINSVPRIDVNEVNAQSLKHYIKTDHTQANSDHVTKSMNSNSRHHPSHHLHSG